MRTIKKVSFVKVLTLFGAVLALMVLPLKFDSWVNDGAMFVDEVYAQDHGGHQGQGGGKGAAGGGGQGQKGSMGGKSLEDQVFRGKDALAAEDDDSDRPPWAGGSKELNPHRGDPNPTAGTKKGGDYGDLWVVVRDPVTGEPLLINGEYQVCLDAGCTEVVLTVEGELPEGVDAAEVEFGRANVVRSPDKVTDHALDEVLAKLTAASVVTLDEAGRLVVDGATVDSPLENLALYIALMTNDPALQPVLDKLPAPLPVVVAGALAGTADKTGTVTIDFVAYFNVIAGIVENGEYVDYSAIDYSRDDQYSGNITYFYQDPVTGVVTEVTEPIMTAVFDGVSYTSSSGAGITDFTQMVDDALQVIEFVHTQIHTETPDVPEPPPEPEPVPEPSTGIFFPHTSWQ
jgi:hypothetical protein